MQQTFPPDLAADAHNWAFQDLDTVFFDPLMPREALADATRVGVEEADDWGT